MLFVLSGCAGRGDLTIVPLNNKQLKTNTKLLYHVRPNRCYWWANDDGQICIAMSEVNEPLWGRRFGRELYLSIVVDEPPAGRGRTYRADRRTVRVRWREKFGQYRAASLRGLVTLWDFGESRLKGRLRIHAKQQSFMVFTGWTGDTQAIVVGEFEAVYDPKRGQAILAKTEHGAMERALLPAGNKPHRVVGPER